MSSVPDNCLSFLVLLINNRKDASRLIGLATEVLNFLLRIAYQN